MEHVEKTGMIWLVINNTNIVFLFFHYAGFQLMAEGWAKEGQRGLIWVLANMRIDASKVYAKLDYNLMNSLGVREWGDHK